MTYRQLVLIAFLGNGYTMLGMQVIGKHTDENQSVSALLAMYASAALLGFFVMYRKQRNIEMKNVLIGVMGGIGSVLGLFFNITAVRYLPGYIVFPVVNGGIILIMCLIGSIIFKEKVGPYGVLGILFGMAAIVLLSMK